MERLTKPEWHAVMSGLEREVRDCWEQARFAWDAGMPQYVAWWVERIEAAKSVYDRMWQWPIESDAQDKEPYEEPYEPIYQEPDSFYTYEPRMDDWK